MSNWIKSKGMITILGPTATGKTELAAHVAAALGGEVLSADSRQVYRGMNIGTGKDYGDYMVKGTAIPFHLIDIVDPGYEYNIFEFQKDFIKAYDDILCRKKIPILCGGSGMYLEAVLKGYRLARAEDDADFTSSLQGQTDEQLIELLRSFRTPHNITDYEDRPRLIKAILVARSQDAEIPDGTNETENDPSVDDQPFPKIDSVIFGINYPRGLVKARIMKRLEYRLEHGMIEEVEQLLTTGITPERMMKYGLEYKFVVLFLTGKISRNDLFLELNIAIRQFAKRQMTWFRRMERQGIVIHWIEGRLPLKKKVEEIIRFTGS